MLIHVGKDDPKIEMAIRLGWVKLSRLRFDTGKIKNLSM